MRKHLDFYRDKRWNPTLQWCKANQVVPQVSKIRVTRPLVNGEGNYNFNIKKALDNYSQDVVLDRNDVFIPFGMGIGISFDTVTTPSYKTPLKSYAPKAGVINEYGFMTNDIEALYNGKLKIESMQTVINESFPTELFKFVPNNVNANLVDNENRLVSLGIQDEYSVEDIIVPLEATYIYQGTMDIKHTLSFNGNGSNFAIAAANDPTTAVTDHQAYITLLMIGALIKDCADSAKLDALNTAITGVR